MWKLDPPQPTVRRTYATCISRIRDVGLKARLEQIEDDVVAASYAFEAAAALTQLHTLETTDDVGGIVTGEEMSKIYTQRMAKAGAPGRDIYDELLAAPAYGRCPLCGHRLVSTLDHHLPKAHYPALSVTPLNLVPSCADCNKAKIDCVPLTGADETLHPYFDDIEDDPWLYATVVKGAPAAVKFFVEPPDEWDHILASRVRRHFRILGLSALYASQASEELLSIRHYLSGLFDKSGIDEVWAHLIDRAASAEAARLNSWQTAAYKAFAASDWFCGGGFALQG